MGHYFGTSFTISSRISLAIRSFGALRIRRSPAAETSTTSFSVASKPMSSLETSLKTIRSERFASSFSRARQPCLAAVGGKADQHLAIAAPLAELSEHVGRRLECHRPRLSALRPLFGALLCRPVVGDRRGD